MTNLDDTDAAALLDDIYAFAGHYVVFRSDAEQIAATLWAAHAHGVQFFDSTPRLAALSPEPGSGKTRLLEVLESLTPNPLHVLSASPAAIFRIIEKNPPTLLCDEVDAIFGRRGKGDENEDLRGLLNAGHRKGATIPRCVGPKHDVMHFPVFCATALAGLGDLPDTLMTRSVVIRMRRRAPDEHVSPWRMRTDPPKGHALRGRLAAWVESVGDRLQTVYPEMPEGVVDRPADVWEPLLAIADAAGGTWPDRARSACVALARSSSSREASLGIRLLADIRSVFAGDDRLWTTQILEGLHAIDEAPWASLKGEPLDARGLAWRLGDYGIESRDVRIGDKVHKGYRATDLHDAWARYTPAPEPATLFASSATSATGAPPLTRDVADVADVASTEETTERHGSDPDDWASLLARADAAT